MSKFVKSKSIKLQNNSATNINRISQQHNQEVIKLNKTYSVQTPIPEVKNIDNETINTSSKAFKVEHSALTSESKAFKVEHSALTSESKAFKVEHSALTNIVIQKQQPEDTSVSFADIYPVQTYIKDVNPIINNVVNKEVTINYGNKLDYLYKKQLYKK
jgi:hypothetical protein